MARWIVLKFKTSGNKESQLTLPSSLVATESHSFIDMSEATFFAIRWSRSFSSAGCIPSLVKFLLPTSPLQKTVLLNKHRFVGKNVTFQIK